MSSLQKRKAYKRVDFERFNQLLPSNIMKLVQKLLPGGKRNRMNEYVVRNPTREDRKPGSFSVHVGPSHKCGQWYDHATGEGGDFIELWRYTRSGSLTRVEAAIEILNTLGE